MKDQGFTSLYQQLLKDFGTTCGCEGCELCAGKSRVKTTTCSVLSPQDVETVDVLAGTLDMVTRDVINLVGWEAIVSLKEDGMTDWTASFVPEEGEGKSCAKKKVITLNNHSDIFSTSEMVDKTMGDDEVSWHGGIRVPFTGFRKNEDGEVKLIKGELLIAFSGAREIVDLGIVIKMLETIIIARRHSSPEANYVYDTSGARKDQVIDFQFKLGGLKRTIQV